ncbi:MAG: heme ABC transporter ATP-binding protein [Acidimicrobiia bacterium]|nr:heme ABC transporter ATP-binding protein [Acidimicrobiia bacterium]
MTEPTIVIEELTYRIRKATLISEIDLDVVPGQVVAVIGPNGAGKSTLLGLVAGNLHPTQGTVHLNGINTSQALPGELALVRSVLTQTGSSDVPYTSAQVVSMGRFPHRRDEANTRERDESTISLAMAQTDTLQFANRPYTTLSKGEQARVALARVIAQAAPIVLLDEPTTALDVAHQERVLKLIVELSREGKTVLVVLHDLNAAAVYAGRVVLMNQGEIVADGTPREVLLAGLLTEVYQQPLTVVDHPFRDCPLVLPGD